MTWVKVDDKLHGHIKARRAGAAPMGLWVMALSYCADHLTDGFVANDVPELFYGPAGLEYAARLVAVGLWVPAEGGWQVHEYLERNPSRAQVLAERSVAAERMAKLRKGSGGVRPNKRRTNGERGPNEARTKPELPANERRSSGEVRSPRTRISPPENTLNVGNETVTSLPSGTSPPAPPPALPLKAEEPLRVLTESSGGRFPAVEGRDIDRGHAIALIAQIKRYPTRAEWEAVGRWLAAGGLGYRTDLGVAWAASAALRDAMASARAWEARGSPPIEPVRPEARPRGWRPATDRAAFERHAKAVGHEGATVLDLDFDGNAVAR